MLLRGTWRVFMDHARRSFWAYLVLLVPLSVFGYLVPAANADVVVYDNGGPNQHGGSGMADFLQSEDFTLAGATTITDVHFWNFQLVTGDYKGSIYWAIQSNAAGTPGAIVASGTTSAVTRSATGLKDTSGTYFEYTDSFNIAPTLLGAGTYWLTLHDGAISDSNFADFYWEWTNDNGNSQEFDLVGGGPWVAALTEDAFQLTGTTIPEPGSVVLLVTILGGLSLSKFRFLRRA